MQNTINVATVMLLVFDYRSSHFFYLSIVYYITFHFFANFSPLVPRVEYRLNYRPTKFRKRHRPITDLF